MKLQLVRAPWRALIRSSAALVCAGAVLALMPADARADTPSTPGTPFTFECQPGVYSLSFAAGLIVGNSVGGDKVVFYFHPTCDTVDPVPASEIAVLDHYLEYNQPVLFPTEASRLAVSQALQQTIGSANATLPTAGTINLKNTHPWGWLGYQYWDLYSGTQRKVHNGTHKQTELWHNGLNIAGNGAAAITQTAGALSGCTSLSGGDIWGRLNLATHFRTSWHGFASSTCLVGAGANGGVVGLGFQVGVDYRVGVNGAPTA